MKWQVQSNILQLSWADDDKCYYLQVVNWNQNWLMFYNKPLFFQTVEFYFPDCGPIPPPVIMVQNVSFRYADDKVRHFYTWICQACGGKTSELLGNKPPCNVHNIFSSPYSRWTQLCAGPEEKNKKIYFPENGAKKNWNFPPKIATFPTISHVFHSKWQNFPGTRLLSFSCCDCVDAVWLVVCGYPSQLVA